MRNFGIPKTVARPASGGNRRPGHTSAGTRADSGQLFINPFEIGSSFLFALVVLLPIALVGGMCLDYAAFAPEPIEYAASFKEIADSSAGIMSAEQE